MKRVAAVVAAVIAVSAGAFGQAASSQPRAPEKVTVIQCGALIDGRSNEVRRNVQITVRGSRIESVGAMRAAFDEPQRLKPWQPVPGGGAAEAAPVQSSSQSSSPTETIDLSKATCLPGLIDTHTHIILQGDIIVDYDEQLLKQSAAYRAIRAVQSSQQCLEHGFTSIRDLETEGAGYADVDVKKAINRGIIPGPRMQVVSRALDVTGAYALLGYNWEYDWPHGVQVCDGADGCRKAVREQIANGADWIKIYADQRTFPGPNNTLDSRPTFTIEEIRAITDEAHRERRRVAAHASGLTGVHNAVEGNVDSIEHGNYIADADLQTMKAKGIWYVPTPWLSEYRWTEFPEQMAAMKRSDAMYEDTFKRARAAGVKIAYGTDAGAFEWTITPAMQLPTMVRYGMTPMQAIQSATSVAAELFGWEKEVGSIEVGKFADIVAVSGDPLADVGVLKKMTFVMKDGVVVKK